MRPIARGSPHKRLSLYLQLALELSSKSLGIAFRQPRSRGFPFEHLCYVFPAPWPPRAAQHRRGFIAPNRGLHRRFALALVFCAISLLPVCTQTFGLLPRKEKGQLSPSRPPPTFDKLRTPYVRHLPFAILQNSSYLPPPHISIARVMASATLFLASSLLKKNGVSTFPALRAVATK